MSATPPPSPFGVCYRHSDRESGVLCTRCDRPICPQCATTAAVGFQCPECIQSAARNTRQARTAFGGSQQGARGIVTIILIVLNTVIFVLSIGSAALVGQSVPAALIDGFGTPLTEAFAAIPYFQHPMNEFKYGGIAGGQYYRLLTAGFLHYGLLHLAMNMLVLWFVGRETERLLGRSRYLALYLLSGLGGTVAVYLFGAANGAAAGASASLFGLFAAMIFFLRRLRLSMNGIITLLVLNLVITFAVPGISIWGHLGGLVSGAMLGAAISYAPNGPQRTAVQVAAISVFTVLLMIAVVVRTITLDASPMALIG